MNEIRCSGTPYEIGFQHGSLARDQVHGSLDFYRDLFQRTCSLDWPKIRTEALKYVETLENLSPEYLEEIRGIADGSGVQLSDIVALNVRTEITFGLFTEKPQLPVQVDGCTSVSLKTEAGSTILAQNWDWQVEQGPNLIICHISQPGTDIPKISMITEAGVIGKIGLNENGVGVCLNAIRARGVDQTKLPVHLGLRAVLESKSRQAAINKLKTVGIAGSAHILVADPTGATGLECTIKGIKALEEDTEGRIVHTNHLLLQHSGVDEPIWLLDSPIRLARMTQLLEQQQASGQLINASNLLNAFTDEEGSPGAINRSREDSSDVETLFNIIMELSEKRATVTVGRPEKSSRKLQLAF